MSCACRRGGKGRKGAGKQKPRYAVFVIYSWNYEVLLTSVEGYQAAGFGDSLIIIDNSPDRRIVGDEKIRGMVGEVLATRARLTFSQSQNYIAGKHLLLSSMPCSVTCQNPAFASCGDLYLFKC